MKVAVLHAPLDLRLDEVPTPEVGPDDLLIKVSAAGICGTDLHFRHMGPRFPEKPMPLGHEYAGEVIEVGANVREFSVGDRVAYNSNNSLWPYLNALDPLTSPAVAIDGGWKLKTLHQFSVLKSGRWGLFQRGAKSCLIPWSGSEALKFRTGQPQKKARLNCCET